MAACCTYDPTKAPRRRHRNTGARRGSGLFTELFTARHTVVTIASAPGYGNFGSPPSSTGPEGGGGARGGVLERPQFSPVKTEVISIPLEDTQGNDVNIARYGIHGCRDFHERCGRDRGI